LLIPVKTLAFETPLLLGISSGFYSTLGDYMHFYPLPPGWDIFIEGWRAGLSTVKIEYLVQEHNTVSAAQV